MAGKVWDIPVHTSIGMVWVRDLRWDRGGHIPYISFKRYGFERVCHLPIVHAILMAPFPSFRSILWLLPYQSCFIVGSLFIVSQSHGFFPLIMPY